MPKNEKSKVEKKKKIIKKGDTKIDTKIAKKPRKSSPKDGLDKYRQHKDDTGSTIVQVMLLSKQINDLTGHLKEHAKDFDSRRGLLIKIGKRRRLLNYLGNADQKNYQKIIKDLKLRK